MCKNAAPYSSLGTLYEKTACNYIESGLYVLNIEKYISDGTPDAVIKLYSELPERAANSDFGEFDCNVVVIDTETTGVSPRRDELTQIAAARLEHGEITDWFITFVNPGKSIPSEVAHLTNIHDEDVKDAPTPQEALTQLVEFVGDAKLVAHNAQFDRFFTTNHPEGYPLLENLWIDSLDLARITLPRMKSHRLIDLVRAFDLPLSTHRADADVRATCALYRLLLAGIEAMPVPLVAEIGRLAPREEWETGQVFSYFAKRTAEASDSEDEPTGTRTQLFSLKDLRSRVTKTTVAPKRDAFDINDEDMKFPTAEQIDEAFAPEGIVGGVHEDYQERAEQLAMAQACRKAFATSDNLAAEAGTGIGKSLAYLTPAAITAIENDITCGVATKTNALLDQLVYHELPALSRAIEKKTGHALTYAALKGFSHYPCLRKIQHVLNEGARVVEVQNEEHSQAPAIAILLSFIQQTDYDDIDMLRLDYRTLPRRAITTTSHECMRRKCPFYGAKCFVHGQRQRAAVSNIVVTNHSLLFCDVAAEGGLLPPVRYWVVDEAHSAEDEARRTLSLEISVDALRQLADRVTGESTHNVFVRAERQVTGPPATDENGEALNVSADDFSTLFYALCNKAKAAGSVFEIKAKEFCAHVPDLLFFDDQKSSSYEYIDIWLNRQIRNTTIFGSLTGAARALIEAAEKLTNACQELVGYIEGAQGSGAVQRDIAATAFELKDLIRAADAIFVKATDEYVYSVTLNRKPDRPGNILHAQLYNVGERLNETLYANTRSVAFVSATLTVAGSFRPFEEAMGLNASPASHARTLELGSAFDFDSSMTIYVPNDMPDPTSMRYMPAISQFLTELHKAQGGSILTLFTNRKEMTSCFSNVEPELTANNLRLICQRSGVSVKGLRDEFLADQALSLFATKTFWEGFDAPGSTLRGVVLAKLPFSKPSDPLECERRSREDAAWRKWVLPHSVIEVKQAVGRLIRKADDQGIVVLADNRLITKSYGQVFLDSMPSHDIRVLSCAEIIDEVKTREERRAKDDRKAADD